MLDKNKDAMDDDVDGIEELEIGLNEVGIGTAAPWKALFNFTSTSHIPVLFLAISFSIASGVIVPALAIFLGKIFDQYSSYGAGRLSASTIVKKVADHSISLCILGGVSGLLSGTFFGFWLAFGESQARTAREQLFFDMLDKEMEWYDMRQSGVETLVSRLQRYVFQRHTVSLQSHLW